MEMKKGKGKREYGNGNRMPCQAIDMTGSKEGGLYASKTTMSLGQGEFVQIKESMIKSCTFIIQTTCNHFTSRYIHFSAFRAPPPPTVADLDTPATNRNSQPNFLFFLPLGFQFSPLFPAVFRFLSWF